MFGAAGVFMEKPHPLYTHMSSSHFKFSTHQQTPSTTTFNSHRSSVRPNSSSNQTGKSIQHIKILFLLIQNLFHYFNMLRVVLLV